MTEQEYKQAKQVLADAPDGATHFALGMHYLALNGSNKWMRYDRNGFKNAKWFVADDFKFSYVKSFHSLSDLRTMVEQYERIAELTSALSMALDACYDVDSHGIRHTNSSYVTALKCLEHKDNE